MTVLMMALMTALMMMVMQEVVRLQLARTQQEAEALRQELARVSSLALAAPAVEDAAIQVSATKRPQRAGP